ncbi:MAG: DUF1501 domain-containing protein [Lysobacteraceae bacterium]
MRMSRPEDPARRRLMVDATRIALGSACGMAMLGRLQMVQAASRADDYRALVCLFLLGGNDSYNMVVPRNTSDYASYAAARPNLAIARETLVPITPSAGSAGADWGLHPAMPEMAALFQQGKAALLANVGPLIVPTSAADVQQQSVQLPPELFSHIDQQAHAMSLGSEVAAAPGWGGRLADRLTERLGIPAGSGRLPLSLTLSGNNAWQNGASGGLYTLGATGATRLDASLRSTGNARWDTRRGAFNALLDLGKRESPVMVRAAAEATRTARDFSESVNAAIDGVTITTPFPSSTLAQQLRTVARVIGARRTLGQTRQVFFVGFGGWDTHDRMLEDHQTLLGTVSKALGAFHQATVELGISASVTSFTMSDFGRTLNNNGDGTDHGWGGHSWVLGGDVVGGRFYGTMNEYALGSPRDAGRGRMVPTTSIEQLGATFARWMGLGYGDALEIFPNLPNFGAGADYLPMLASTNARLNDVGFTRSRGNK